MTPSTPSDYSDDRLLAFLRRKLAGEPLPTAAATHFHNADIYAADPAILTSVHEPAPAKKGDGDSWFFFTHVKPKSSRDTRKSRQVAGGVGTWHSERAPRAVLDDEGNCVGNFQYFSYKIKTGKNCSERTQWYMVEFSVDDQEGNHDRIHGGEPVLVLSKIYKAHPNSRLSTARKRKPTDELVNQASSPSPVKAKRRLFGSPAPVSSSVASQEPVSSKACYDELAVILKSLHRGIESKPSQDEAELEASHKQVRSYQLSSCLESFCSGLVPKPSQDEEAKREDPETSQEKLSSRALYNLQLQGKSNATLDSAFRSELDPSQDKVLDSVFRSEIEPSQDKISESMFQRFWTEVIEEPGASQEKLSSRASFNLQLQGKNNATLDSAFRSELDPLQDKVLDSAFRLELSQDKISESIIQRFWTEVETEVIEEPEASQEKLSSRSSYNLQLQGKGNATLDSGFRSELEPSQDKVSESIIQRFWTEAKTEASEKASQDKSNATLDSALRSKLEPSQDIASKIQRFWTSETEASQIDRATMNCSFLMAGGAPTMPVHCAPEMALSSASWTGNDITTSCSTELGWFVGGAPPMPSHCALGALSSASWMSNDITASCSSELGWVVGAPTYNEFDSIAGGGYTIKPDVHSIPFAPVPSAAAASCFFSGLDIWSC